MTSRDALTKRVTKVIKAHVSVYLENSTVTLKTPLGFRYGDDELWETLADIEKALGLYDSYTRKVIMRNVDTVDDLVWAMREAVERKEARREKMIQRVTSVVKRHIGAYLDQPASSINVKTELDLSPRSVVLWATMGRIYHDIEATGLVLETSARIASEVKNVGELILVLIEALDKLAEQRFNNAHAAPAAPPVPAEDKPSANMVIEACQTYTQRMVRIMQTKGAAKQEAMLKDARDELHKAFAELGIAEQLDWNV